MSDHAWTQEHIAAFVAGGLTAAEADRLEAHAQTCPECAAALSAARRLDSGLDALFAPARPSPALEDRAIWAFRTGRPRPRLLAGWARRVAVAAGVLIVLGTFGALAGSVVSGGRLPVPGDRWRDTASGDYAARMSVDLNELKSLATPVEKERTPPNEPAGAPTPWAENLKALPDPKAPSPVDSAKVPEPSPPTHLLAAGSPPAVAFTDGSVTGMPYWDVRSQPVAPGGAAPPARYGYGNWNGAAPGGFGGGGFNGRGFGPPDVAAPSFHHGLTYFTPAEARPAPSFREEGVQPGAAKNPPPPPAAVATPASPPNKPPPPSEPGVPPPPGAGPAGPPAPNPEPARRVVIRSGDIEFEVESFDAAVATVTKLVTGIKGAFVATINSEKLPNGKTKGSITVRTPPEHLDGLVLDLRKELGKGGELKGVRIGSQDITKQYTDLESRLRAARTMEQRLLQIIKEGKGEIKQLLEAERELGVWRTRIEEVEGELRYYSNLVSLSTLTVSLAEKEIRVAAGITEVERVQAGVEVEDVEKAYQQLLAVVAEARGRVGKSEMKQLAAGQFNATLNFEVAPEAAGPVRDRLRQLGRVARLEVDRLQQPEAGAVAKDARVRRGDTVFLVQFYNLANVAPRETAVLQVAVPDVSAAYQSLRDAVAKAAGRVVAAQLNEQDRQNVTAQLDFEVPRADEGTVRAALDATGEVVSRQVARTPEGDNVTDTKVLYRATLVAAGRLKPREVTTLSVEVADVDQTTAMFGAQVAEAKGRQVDAQSTRERSGRVTAKVVYEVPLAAAAGLVERFKAAGTVRVQQSTRDPGAADGKYATARLDVTVSNPEGIVSADDGLWPPVRRGLSYSASVLLTSVTWVVFGLCVVLPWVVVGYAGYRAVRWATRSGPVAEPPATPPTA